MLSTACFVIRSSTEILPKVWQPQAVHWASYESFGLCSTTSIVGSLQSGQKVGRISIAPPGDSQYMTLLRSWRTTNNAERAARHSSIVVARSSASPEQYRDLRAVSQAIFRSLGSAFNTSASQLLRRPQPWHRYGVPKASCEDLCPALRRTLSPLHNRCLRSTNGSASQRIH